MSATGLLGHHKLPVLFVVVCLLSLSAAVSRAWGQAPAIQNTVYTYGQPNTTAPVHTPHGMKIPGHLVNQAMGQHWQQVAYQPQLANHAATGQPGGGNAEPVYSQSEYVMGTDYSGYGEVYGSGADRYRSGGVDPRLITTQRYGDHYIQANVDFIQFTRSNMSTITKKWVDRGPEGDRTGGIRTSLRLNPFYSCDFEFAYLNARWTGNIAPSQNSGPPGLTDLWWNERAFTPPGNLGGGSIDNTTFFHSKLNSYEFNTRWRWVDTIRPCTGAWILGVRYVTFEEVASGTCRDLSGAGNLIFRQWLTTNNDLVGFQLGGELFWSVAPRVMIGGDIKGGIYGNSAERTYRDIEIAGTGTAPTETSSSRSHAAFLGEANLMVNAALSHGVYIRGGYTCLYMSNLALVGDDLNRPAPGTLGPSLPIGSLGGFLLAHGFYGGLEWQY